MPAHTLHTDVLIVGAGSAGSVVAERLSADPRCSVVIVEAGPGLADPAFSALAADGLQLPIGAASPLVTHYQTELTQRPVRVGPIVRGTTVGGSGAVNGGYFCRGLPRDFEVAGVPGWAWADVLDHFVAIETDLDFHGSGHGDRGPIPVRRSEEIAGNTARFVDSAQRAGFPWIADLNGDSARPGMPVGVGPVPLNMVDGVRVGPGVAYLLPALSRPNLTLREQTRVWRVRIAEGRAVGVDAVGRSGPITLTADRIVLAAGAIGSAHLLMLSGVGNEDMLRSAGVAVVTPLPVGMSCTDHPEWILPADWEVAAGRPVLEVVLCTDDDVEIRPYTCGFGAMVGEPMTGHQDPPHIGVALMRPRSRGRITLVSADPRVPPRIEHRYDSEPDDVAALRRGAELARELAGPPAEVGPPVWATSQHLCGSAPMGTDHDEQAVLDPRCRVRGIEGLWVIDGSALPTITSRGPHATVVMLGHRAAEFVAAG